MLHEITKHLAHYLSLIGIIGAGLWGLLYFSYDKGFQTALAVAVGAAFVIWGIVHHHIHEELHLKIVLEYIMISVFGIIILLTVIWNIY